LLTAQTRRLSELEVIERRSSLATARHVLSDDVRTHAHDFLEVALVAGGAGRHVSARGDEEIEAGVAIVLPVGAWHGFIACRELDVRNCYVARRVLERELAWAWEDTVLGPMLASLPVAPVARLVRLDAQGTKRCLDLLRLIEENADRRAEAIGYLIALLARIARTSSAVPLADVATPLHPAVAAAIRLFEMDISRSWKMDALAKAVYLNRSHLTRVFQRQVGLSPSSYLLNLRLDRAASLLLTTELPVFDVAARVGLADTSYFARRFRIRFGESPTQYRRGRSRRLSA
jgi:AraC-like DNA-binding protein